MNASELFDLTGEVALVTGASSGLGARFAEVLAAHGAKVVIAARRCDRLADLKARIKRAGGEAEAVAMDVAERGAITAGFDAAEQVFGTVTLVVNNAGISGPPKPALEVDDDDWRRVLAVDLDAVWYCCQEAARRLVAAGKPGAIINIASLLAFRVATRVAPYSVAKAGVKQLTSALALDLARHNIRVNAIAPGYVMSEMTSNYLSSPDGQAMLRQIPQQRTGQPTDLDGTLLLLASHKASGFMTGSTIVVDGGHMLSGVR